MTSGAGTDRLRPGHRSDAAAAGAAAPPSERRRRSRSCAWIVFILGVALLLPAADRRRSPSRSGRSRSARPTPRRPRTTRVLREPRLLVRHRRSSRSSSASLIIVPTAYWVRLRLPRLGPIVEFVTLMPFVIPPIVLVFGLIRIYSQPPLPLDAHRHRAATSCSSRALRRSCRSRTCTGRSTPACAAIDVRTLTEAAQSLGAGWVADPLVRSSSRTSGSRSCRGAFLTLAIVIGEFTIAQLPGPAGVRAVPVAPRREQGLRAGGRVAHQLRADLDGDGHDRVPRAAARASRRHRSPAHARRRDRPMAFLELDRRPEALRRRRPPSRTSTSPPSAASSSRSSGRPAAARRRRCG